MLERKKRKRTYAENGYDSPNRFCDDPVVESSLHRYHKRRRSYRSLDDGYGENSNSEFRHKVYVMYQYPITR